MNETAAKKGEPRKDESEQQHFIECFDRMFALDPAPPITLINIYKEIPISYPAVITDVKTCYVELRTAELQLAAISQCQQAYIKAPFFEKPIVGGLCGIDVRHSTVRLTNFSFADFDEEKRMTLRVRFKKPVGITLNFASEKVSGVIHDISLGGCCVNTFARIKALPDEEVEAEIKLTDQKANQISCLRIPSRIVRFQGDAPPFKAALRFQHSPQTERLLSSFINQRQFEILKELRESL